MDGWMGWLALPLNQEGVILIKQRKVKERWRRWENFWEND